MKPKKIVAMALLSIPLYFCTPNHAKADDFKVNLKDSTVEIDKTDKDYLADDFPFASNTDEATNLKKYLEEQATNKKKEGNYFEDSDFSGFMLRVNNRVEKIRQKKYCSFHISRDLAKFLRNPEDAVAGMDDIDRKIYLDKINDELWDEIVKEGLKGQYKEEWKSSTFYKNFKKNVSRYKKKVKGNFKNPTKVLEKELYITEKGSIKFKYKEQNYYPKNYPHAKNAVKPANAELIIEETYIEKLPNGKAKLHLTSNKTGVHVEKGGGFEWDIDADLFSFHSFDYNPDLDVKLITKKGIVHFNTEYELRKGRVRARLTSPLPKKCSLNIYYNLNTKTDADTLSTTISKSIKRWSVSLSYSAKPEDLDRGACWLRFERRF